MTRKDPNEPIADYVPYLLAQAHRNVHLRMEKLLKREGVQVEHWRVLEILSTQQGRSMGDLAELVLMNHPALTKMVDRMVANGLVHRLPDPHDQRRVLVHITDSGFDLFGRLRKHADKYNQEFTTNLGSKKVDKLKALLEELIEETPI